MMISTRGRYALRVMVDLAEHSDGGYIPMKEVAQRQNISLKYLERILPALTKNQYIEGLQGKGGGYRLTRKPSEYSVRDILHLAEGGLVPVSCHDCNAEPCERAADCRTKPVWDELNGIIQDYLSGISLADLMKQEKC